MDSDVKPTGRFESVRNLAIILLSGEELLTHSLAIKASIVGFVFSIFLSYAANADSIVLNGIHVFERIWER